MSRPLLLKGGRVIDPSCRLDAASDLLILEGRVAEVAPAGRLVPPERTETIDCSGLWVTPGLIDPHVHLRDPGFPYKETIKSGLAAAVKGGFTTVAAMANTSPVNDTPAVAHYMLERARAADSARLLPVSAVTIGLAGAELVDFDEMAAAGAALFSDDGIPIDREDVLRAAFRQSARTGMAVSLHEEDRALTGRGACHDGPVARRLGVAGLPIEAESARVKRDLEIAASSGGHVHIAHVATADSLALIRAARHRGLNVTCEVTPHHFTLTDEAFARWGPNAKMAPPLRSQRDTEALAEALADGTICMIATDHAPHDPGSKQMQRLGRLFDGKHEALRLSPADAAILTEAANGIIGLETSLPLALALVHRGVIDAGRLVTLMSSNPALLLRCEGGTLAPRSPADITVIDSTLQWSLEAASFCSISRNTPFSGMPLTGAVMMTIVGGRIVYARDWSTRAASAKFN
ncbi:MAG TPA: dihydroorotase [Candidatus Binataceae bacterium]|nr:dihydroorotase [Candidatus Binataceae bacterium]